MNRAAILVMASGLAGSIQSASAQTGQAPFTAYDLYKLCMGETGQFGQEFCLTFLAGVAAGANLEAQQTKDTTSYCAPNDLTAYRIKDLFVTSAAVVFSAKPQRKETPAAAAVIGSLEEAYPCAKQ
jgi:hypothetical protein